jgi:dTDP-4-amino-4,6-dideoxygalactose transaminase
VNVPFVDLRAQHAAIADEVLMAAIRVMERADFILGEEVARFEDEFARYCEARYAVGTDNGISALELTLRACGVGPGDEVIVPAHTFIATASAVSFIGARPVLVDIDPRNFGLDPSRVEAAVTPRTRALMPVHLYGQPVDVDPLLEIARRRGLFLVEDACQAHGARYKGRRVGALGRAGCFSFYPAKNLGAYGDGGAVVTDDQELADRVRMLRNYGQREKYQHAFLAYNRRLDTLQAAILRVKLRSLDRWNEARRRIAAIYDEGLRGSIVSPPKVALEVEHVYHLYVVRTPDRDGLQKHLTARGVTTGLHYPIPIHLQEAYRDLGHRFGEYPEAEQAAAEGLSLPMYPEMSQAESEYVVEAIRAYGGTGASAAEHSA